jgi:hypothetical protein
MLFREVNGIYCDGHNKYINTKCAQNAEFLNITSRSKITYKCVLNSEISHK